MSERGTKRLSMVVHARYPVGEPRVQREARAAVADGWEVEVICLREGNEPSREEIDGVAIRRVPLSHARGAGSARIFWEYLGFTLFAAGLLTFRRRRPDVIQVHSPPDFLAAAALAPRLRGSRVVLDIHDLSPHMYLARFRPGIATRVLVAALTRVERLACRFAQRVLTVHEPYRAELCREGVPASKVTVVMNAADEAVIREIQESRAPRAGTNGLPFTVAYHGTVTPWYGVDLMVEAAALLNERVPSLRMLVLGDGDAVADVRRLAEERGVASRLEVSARYLPLEETLGRVAGAHCGVIPNRPTTLNRFALSSKLFEYVALGIPAVVARLPTLSAHFDEDEVTFFDPGDARSLAEGLAWVHDHPAEAREKAVRAARRAEGYSWRVNREKYVAVLEALGATR